MTHGNTEQHNTRQFLFNAAHRTNINITITVSKTVNSDIFL